MSICSDKIEWDQNSEWVIYIWEKQIESTNKLNAIFKFCEIYRRFSSFSLMQRSLTVATLTEIKVCTCIVVSL